jgi:hypothetical protein
LLQQVLKETAESNLCKQSQVKDLLETKNEQNEQKILRDPAKVKQMPDLLRGFPNKKAYI